jgi:transcriptional regulator with XRE-family HTH domain
MDTTTWGTNLRTARLAAGLTQRQLADLADSSQQTISDIEGGDHPPSDALKVRLGRALKVHPHDLFPLVPPAEVA